MTSAATPPLEIAPTLATPADLATSPVTLEERAHGLVRSWFDSRPEPSVSDNYLQFLTRETLKHFRRELELAKEEERVQKLSLALEQQKKNPRNFKASGRGRPRVGDAQFVPIPAAPPSAAPRGL